MTTSTEPLASKERSAPHLPATAVHAEIRKPHKHAVYVRLKVMDQKGDTYYFETSCFAFDLKHPEEIGL